MTGIQSIQSALEGTKGLLNWFVADFSDADLMVRPCPGANHTAWQIGNVIAGDIFFVNSQFPDAKFPALPEGFMERHGNKGTGDDDAKHFLTKDAYLKLLNDVRAVTIAELGKLSDADLDKPTTGHVKDFAPTMAKMFQMASDHTIMHAGQFSVIRRKLGKPVLF